MKHAILLLAAALALACKTDKSAPVPSIPETESLTNQAPKPASGQIPETLAQVLDAHGGLELWKRQRTLSFRLPKGPVTETHTIDLWNRRDRVEAETYSMGHDGTGTWVHNPDSAFEGNPDFYHNLFFYFYAMPFVLADPGIVYGTAPDLEYEGVSYPGLRITYRSGVGTSPEDEYFLHYDPADGRMAWLGYTVTYGKEAPSEDIHWIRYNEWQPVGGLLLPASISWYTYEGRQIKALRNTMRFEEVRVSPEAMAPGFYAKPDSLPYFKPVP